MNLANNRLYVKEVWVDHRAGTTVYGCLVDGGFMMGYHGLIAQRAGAVVKYFSTYKVLVNGQEVRIVSGNDCVITVREINHPVRPGDLLFNDIGD